jgi:hypothetical protein
VSEKLILGKIREDQENERREGEILKKERETYFETQTNKLISLKKDGDKEKKELNVCFANTLPAVFNI